MADSVQLAIAAVLSDGEATLRAVAVFCARADALRAERAAAGDREIEKVKRRAEEAEREVERLRHDCDAERAELTEKLGKEVAALGESEAE